MTHILTVKKSLLNWNFPETTLYTIKVDSRSLIESITARKS